MSVLGHASCRRSRASSVFTYSDAFASVLVVTPLWASTPGNTHASDVPGHPWWPRRQIVAHVLVGRNRHSLGAALCLVASFLHAAGQVSHAAIKLSFL